MSFRTRLDPTLEPSEGLLVSARLHFALLSQAQPLHTEGLIRN